ncbi:phosphate ABC transporter permease PstA [Thermaurantiacus sp.]
MTGSGDLVAETAIALEGAPAVRVGTDWASAEMRARIAKRYRAERLFRLLGVLALAVAGGFLLFLLATIVRDGWNSFRQTEVKVEVSFDRALLGLAADETPSKTALLAADWPSLLLPAYDREPGLERAISEGAWVRLRDLALKDPAILGSTRAVWLTAASNTDLLAKGAFDLTAAEEDRRVSDREIALFRKLEAEGRIRIGFNRLFLTQADSTVPEQAGIWGALKGSVLTILVTLALAFPVGVLSAIYLEEFAPRNRLTDIVEVSINNLAAVPSIIFGLLGLAVFLNAFGMPRSAPLVGGLTLALMTLPVIVIAARAAVKAVPPSIRDAALGVGASKVQVVFHHVLPLALPGILTGTIIGVARALGETAPLLMIGMRAFLIDAPAGVTEPATTLPVQIFIWSDNVARGFIEKTSGAIVVLLLFLLTLNSVAIWLRNRYEVRW